MNYTALQNLLFANLWVFILYLITTFGEKLRCKGSLVEEWHARKPHFSVTYIYVVPSDSVHISLLLAALDNLEIKCTDIESVYLTRPPEENNIHGQCLNIGSIKINYVL